MRHLVTTLYAAKDITEKDRQLFCMHMRHWNLPMDSLRGQTYDGAANMAKEYNGCQAIMSPRQPLATKLWLRPPTNHNAILDH